MRARLRLVDRRGERGKIRLGLRKLGACRRVKTLVLGTRGFAHGLRCRERALPQLLLRAIEGEPLLYLRDDALHIDAVRAAMAGPALCVRHRRNDGEACCCRGDGAAAD